MAWSGYQKRVVYGGITNVSCIVDPIGTVAGAPKTGLAFGDVTSYYVIPGAVPVEIPVSALASATAAHTPGGWFELSPPNTPGAYRFDLPDEMFVVGTPSVQIYLASVSTEYPIVLFEFFDQFLPADLGTSRGPWNSVLEALQALRAYVVGTRRFTRETGVEEILMSDRATVLATRAAEPVGGPVSRLVERGDITVRVSAAGGIVFEGKAPTTGKVIDPPAAGIVFEGATPTLPFQVGAGGIVFEGKAPTTA